MSHDVVMSLMNSLQAEVLLEGSHILTQIAKLRQSLCQRSLPGQLSYDDYFDFLEREVEAIPRLELLRRVAPRTESTYILELVESLDQIQEKITITQNLALRFQARLVNAQTAIAEVGGAFEAWYSLAAQEILKASKMSQSTVKTLAQSEFSRLMGGVPEMITSLVVAVKAETEMLANKKKMAREKVDLGREQVQAAWTSRLPPIDGVSGDPGSLGLIKNEPEEENHEPPAYVSKRARMDEPNAATHSYSDQGGYEPYEPEPAKVTVVESIQGYDPAAMTLEQSPTGPKFIKHGGSVLVETISPAKAIEQFNDQKDDGIEKPPVIDAIPAEITASIPRIPDELDSIVPDQDEDQMERLRKTMQTPPVWETATQRVPIGPVVETTPPKRKTSFSYTDDIA